MADAVTSKLIQAGPRNRVLLLTCISDGTGGAVTVLDKSTLALLDGSEPEGIAIQSVQWTMQGFTYLKLAWDHTADDTALVLGPDRGKLCFRDFGGLTDPASTGGTGDLLLTVVGAASGDSYTLLLHLTLY